MVVTDPATEGARIQEAVAGGALVLYRPEAACTWPGCVTEVSSTRVAALAALGVPLLPVAVERPRDSALEIERAGGLPQSIIVPGQLLREADAAPARVLEEWLLGAEEAFSRRPLLRTHLGWAILRGIKRRGARATIIDGTDESSLTYFEVLAAACALSREIRRETQKPRVGVVLPPGRAGLIANLAVILADKVPVNLNFTAGKEAVESAIRQSDIDRLLTVDLVVRKMQGFPWPPTRQLILIERLMPRLKKSAVKWGVAARLLPAPVVARLLGLPKAGGEREATLLFTSGSSGEPKGVPLSHRNLLANVSQIGARLNLGESDRILGSLPLFHSFGCTVTLWFPLIEGIGLVTWPSPMEAPKLAALIEKHSATLLLSTPTFLRGFLRKVNREQLSSVRFIVTGAEKLPSSLADSVRNAFGRDVMEGYGLTETSPATNLNLPTLPPAGGRETLDSHRPGSVGQFLTGIAVRITHPVTEERLPINQSGIIWLKGGNVFSGYLNQPGRTAEVIRDGWFRTGDIGRVDEDGFLYIEGRLSRFSKIGGEMVPHETVEEHIVKALGLDGDAERRVAVVGIPDPEKGEALVLLSTVAGETIKQELIQLRYALLERGVPALWIPKKMLGVKEIPLLASGKLDIKKCEELARMA